jgi:hypothetical protein
LRKHTHVDGENAQHDGEKGYLFVKHTHVDGKKGQGDEEKGYLFEGITPLFEGITHQKASSL